MKKIYVKNYKGFSEEIINLTTVNFFVGENSTGKSSVLKLINILNSQQFWFYQSFNNNEVELGFFDEILNKNATEKFFRIGIEQETNSYQRVIFEFHNENSEPILKNIKFRLSKGDVLLSFTSKQTRFKVKELKDNGFKEWCNDFNFESRFKKIDVPQNRVPLFILFTSVEDQLEKKDDLKSRRLFGSEPVLYKNYIWLAPIRAKAKRIYESYQSKFSPDGEHIPSLLRSLISKSNKKDKQKILRTIKQFGKESNLFDDIKIKNYGPSSSSPFEIIILYNNTEIKLPNVGYGVSQSLPLIIEILSSKGYAFSIQQPEVHLHPKAQAAFGSFILNSASNDKNTFLIETHSDFTINRFRYNLSKKKKNKVDGQVLFFERNGTENSVSHIKIDSNGTYQDDIPENYMKFFIDEELKLLSF